MITLQDLLDLREAARAGHVWLGRRASLGIKLSYGLRLEEVIALAIEGQVQRCRELEAAEE